MQKVAWPMTIVVSENCTPPNAKNEFSAIPVMIPGSAIGRTSTNETASRPKKRKRCTANAAADPRTTAIAVARSAARTESHSAWRMSSSLNADENHRVESPPSGQLCTFEGLNA
jgi:hypothetical protein